GKPWSIAPEIAGQTLNQRIVDNVVASLVQARADEVVGDAASSEELQAVGLGVPLARLEVATAAGACAALSAAPAPSAAAAPIPGAPRPAATFVVRNDSRTAVMRA